MVLDYKGIHKKIILVTAPAESVMFHYARAAVEITISRRKNATVFLFPKALIMKTRLYHLIDVFRTCTRNLCFEQK